MNSGSDPGGSLGSWAAPPWDRGDMYLLNVRGTGGQENLKAHTRTAV